MAQRQSDSMKEGQGQKNGLLLFFWEMRPIMTIRIILISFRVDKQNLQERKIGAKRATSGEISA
jgi:hypothetical protein